MSVAWVARTRICCQDRTRGFTVWQAGGCPGFHPFFWLADNFFPLFWSRFRNVCQTRSRYASKHVRLAGETWYRCQPMRAEACQWQNKQCHHISFLLHWAISDFGLVEFLLCTFYLDVSILKVVLPSSGSWCISLTYISMIAEAKQPQWNRLSTQFVAMHGKIRPFTFVCIDTASHCYCLYIRPICLH